MTKTEIRKLYKEKRNGLGRAEAKEKSAKIQDAFLASELYKNATQIMLYMPLGNETDTAVIVAVALADGKKLVFPVTDRKTYEITPVLWDGESDFFEGAFSVKEPIGAEIADMNMTDLVIVPGIAFDKSGARVGFGKGCYDRLLESAKVVKVGLCYDFQICDEIPADSHDIKMDFLVSESGWINCKEE